MKAFQLAPIALCILVAGCSTNDLLMQRKVDYRTSNDNLSKAPLDVPPDLSAPKATATFTIPTRSPLAADASVAKSEPSGAKAKLVSAGGQRWLVIKEQPEKVWSSTREFWMANGFIMTMDNPALGIMETDWRENRAKMPKDGISQLLSKISSRFASTGELDKYRVRMERGTEPGTTEIFLTHRGMIEAYRDTGSTKTTPNKNDIVDVVWIPRASDPELEAEMLVSLLQEFGMEEPAARNIVKAPEQIAKSDLITLPSGEQALNIADTMDRAWRRVGQAIERVGFVISDRDRTQGVYYVHRADTDIAHEASSGFWSKLAFWNTGKETERKAAAQIEYLVQLKQQPGGIALTLKPKDKADPELEKQLMADLVKQFK